MNEINWPKLDSEHLIVYSEQMLNLENDIFSKGMPMEALMEKVGIEISNWLLKRKELLKNGVVVAIGPGHNGGDGAIIARELFLKGVLVTVWCPFPIKKTITARHLNYITSIGVQNSKEIPDPKKNNLWIDAIFGNNQKRSLNNEPIEIFNKKFEGNFGKIVSIDIPTGLCPNTGEIFGEKAVKANYTIAIGLKKVGILQDTAMPYVGNVVHLNIGLTCNQISKISKKILCITPKDIHGIKFSMPLNNVSKHSRGRTLLIAGSNKYLGSASLVIKGALSSGVGFINAFLPETVAKSIWQVAPEIVVDCCMKNSPKGDSLIHDSLKETNLSKFDSIVLGPGIGIDVADWENSLEYLLEYRGLLILDADALNRIARSELGYKFFLKRKFKTWITPHKKEFERLFPDMKAINDIELATNTANQNKIGVLLKGANSIIADEKGFAWQIHGSDPSSARAGFGDLLSGFVGGMSAIELASGLDITTESFAKYVFLHSYAALKTKKGSSAITIGDKLSKIIRQLKPGQMS